MVEHPNKFKNDSNSNIYKNQYLPPNELEKLFTFYDYKILEKYSDCLLIKKSGYSHLQLIDGLGQLHIIHPFETKFIRNVMNKIININDISENKKLENTNNIYNQIGLYFKPMFIMLRNRLLYVKIDKTFEKTIFSEKILQIKRDITSSFLEERESIALLIGAGYNIELEIAEILSLISACNKSMFSLASIQNKDITHILEKILKYLLRINLILNQI